MRWAATLHDVRRVDDYQDILHGQRAADWLRQNVANIPCGFNEHQVHCTAYCCIWHVPHDHLIPAFTPELTCLKDADSLDRVRLGDLDIKYLRTSYAKNLTDKAQKLFDKSQRYGLPNNQQWLAVRQAALDLGLWH